MNIFLLDNSCEIEESSLSKSKIVKIELAP